VSIFSWLLSIFSPRTASTTEPKWLALARADLGTREEPGDADSPAVLAYYRDAGHPEVRDDSVAWCSAFVGAQLERSGVPSSKQLNARSYLTWGKKIDKPVPGCVVVLSRGDPRGWQGHVGFCVGDDRDSVRILGGNQGDAVSIASFPKSRVLGYRWPVTAGNSRTFRASTAGIVGDGLTIAGVSMKGVVDALPDAIALGDGMRELAAYWPWFSVAGIVLSLVARAVVIWARVSDLKEKGR
jgi:uncharacterized protein (TIGR02594 family)